MTHAKPCPHCGAELRHIESLAKSFQPPRTYHEWHHPENPDCWLRKTVGCIVFTSTDQDADEAIAAWNRRASQEAAAPSEEPVAWDVCTEDGTVTQNHRNEAHARASADYFNAHGDKRTVKPLYYASPAPVAPVAVGVKEAARVLIKSLAIYTVEDDEGIRLSTGGYTVANYGEHSREGAAILRLEAAIEAVRAALSGGIATPKPEGVVCRHDWKIWPETDGQEQKCMKCGAYRKTPFFDRIETKLAADAGIVGRQSWDADVDTLIREIAELDDRTSPADYPEHMLITPVELRQFAREVAALSTAPAGDGVAGMVHAGSFLLDRLDDFERNDHDDEEWFRDYMGHVSPAVARFRAALSASTAGGGK